MTRSCSTNCSGVSGVPPSAAAGALFGAESVQHVGDMRREIRVLRTLGQAAGQGQGGQGVAGYLDHSGLTIQDSESMRHARVTAVEVGGADQPEVRIDEIKVHDRRSSRFSGRYRRPGR
jgi:hypothetical protein